MTASFITANDSEIRSCSESRFAIKFNRFNY